MGGLFSPASVLVAVWAAVVAAAYLIHFPPALGWISRLSFGPFTPWGDYAAALTWLAVLGFSAYGAGAWLIRDPLPALALGAGLLSSLTLGLGLLGWLHSGLLRVVILVLGCAGAMMGWRARVLRTDSRVSSGVLSSESMQPIRRSVADGADDLSVVGVASSPPSGDQEVAPTCLLLMAWVVGLVFALGPEVWYDSLEYHLGLPYRFLTEGRVAVYPWQVFSHLPLGTEMLYTIALALHGPTLAKLVSWGVWVLLTLSIRRLGAEMVGPSASAWAAAVVACTPAVLFNARVTAAEGAVTLWTFLALASVWRWMRTDSRRALLLAGAFAGFAAGAKYAGLFVCAVLGAMALWHGGLRPALRFGLVAVALFLPWPVRSYLASGNPVYPYFESLPGRTRLPPGQAAAWVGTTRGSHLIQTWRDRLLHPWILTTRQHEAHHHAGPVYLALAPLVLWAAFRGWPGGALAAQFALGYWALWASVSMGVRFLLPAFPVLALAGLSFMDCPVRVRAGLVPARRLVTLALAAACVIGLLRAADKAVDEGGWRVVLGVEGAGSFLSRQAHPSYPAIDFANRSLPADAKILFVGETRGAYLERRALVGSSFDWPPLAEFAARSADGEALYANLRAAGVTHLLVHEGVGRAFGTLDRWRTPSDAAKAAALRRFHVRPLFHVGDLSLSAIRGR